MRKLALLAALVALLSIPFGTTKAATSAALDGRKITLECADGSSIRTFESDPTIWIFAQKWECQYHEAKSLFQIFEEKLDSFIR